MIRPFYRSLLFWLGLPGLLFLIWLWVAFLEKRVTATLVLTGTYGIDVTHGGGFLAIQDLDVAPRKQPPWPKGIRWETEFRSNFDPPKPIRVGAWPQTPNQARSRWIAVSYWFPIPIYVAAWSLLLIYWQRRKSRLLKLQAAPPP